MSEQEETLVVNLKEDSHGLININDNGVTKKFCTPDSGLDWDKLFDNPSNYVIQLIATPKPQKFYHTTSTFENSYRILFGFDYYLARITIIETQCFIIFFPSNFPENITKQKIIYYIKENFKCDFYYECSCQV